MILMNMELECKSLSLSIYESLKEETKTVVEKGFRAPGLAVITVGDDPASHLYVKTKTDKAEMVGYVHFQYFLNEDSREEEIISLIEWMEYLFSYPFQSTLMKGEFLIQSGLIRMWMALLPSTWAPL